MTGPQNIIIQIPAADQWSFCRSLSMFLGMTSGSSLAVYVFLRLIWDSGNVLGQFLPYIDLKNSWIQMQTKTLSMRFRCGHFAAPGLVKVPFLDVSIWAKYIQAKT